MDNRVELWWSKHKEYFLAPILTLGLILFFILIIEFSSYLLLYLSQNSGAQDQRLDAYQEQHSSASPAVGESLQKVTEKIQNNPTIKILTSFFDNHPETLFVDWSHISEAGNALVAESMAQEIQAALRRES